MIIKPLGNHLLIDPIVKEEEKVIDGIFIPEAAQRNNLAVSFGIVKDFGLTTNEAEMKDKYSISIGDTVMLPKDYKGVELKINGKNLLIYKPSEILGVLHA